METFDLDFHILMPGGEFHVFSLLGGAVVIPAPASPPAEAMEKITEIAL